MVISKLDGKGIQNRRKLNQSYIDKLTPGNRLYFVCDTEVVGLRIICIQIIVRAKKSNKITSTQSNTFNTFVHSIVNSAIFFRNPKVNLVIIFLNYIEGSVCRFAINKNIFHILISLFKHT